MSGGTKAQTRADRDALARLPDGWFFVNEVSFMVRNPRWRCDRLVEFKLLESEVTRVGDGILDLEMRYRKIPGPSQEELARRHQMATAALVTLKKEDRGR